MEQNDGEGSQSRRVLGIATVKITYGGEGVGQGTARREHKRRVLGIATDEDYLRGQGTGDSERGTQTGTVWRKYTRGKVL